MNPEDFFTLDRENAGSRMYLIDPSGKQTKEWVDVFGANSDQFSTAEYRHNKRLAELASDSTLTEDQKLDVGRRVYIELIASLISGWSFGVDCSDKSKYELLKNAPKTREAINIFAKKISNYSQKDEKNSEKELES